MTTPVSGLRLPILLAITALASVYAPSSASGLSSTVTPSGTTRTPPVYIVQLAEEPVVAYAGGRLSLSATRPAKGRKIDPKGSAVRNYVAYLDSRHAAVLNAAGAAARRGCVLMLEYGGCRRTFTAHQLYRETGGRAAFRC